MAREFSRTQRVAEQLRRDLAQLIQQEIKDPRLGMVTVNGVKISKDLSYADVYITVLGIEETEEEIAMSVKILNNAAGFLRGREAKQIKLRVMPQFRFHYDASVSRGNYLSSLINKAVSEDRQRQEDAGSDTDPSEPEGES